MKNFYNNLGTLIFKITIYLVLLGFFFTTTLTLKFELYDITFQTLLIAAATIIAIGQSFFSYAETTTDELTKLSQLSGRKLMKVAIWLGSTSIILLIYILFKIHIDVDNNLENLISWLLLVFAFLNLLFAMTNLHAALWSIQKILYRKVDSEF